MYRNIIENFKNTDFIVRIISTFKSILTLKNDVLEKQDKFIEEIISLKMETFNLYFISKKNIKQHNFKIKFINFISSIKIYSN